MALKVVHIKQEPKVSEEVRIISERLLRKWDVRDKREANKFFPGTFTEVEEEEEKKHA